MQVQITLAELGKLIDVYGSVRGVARRDWYEDGMLKILLTEEGREIFFLSTMLTRVYVFTDSKTYVYNK